MGVVGQAEEQQPSEKQAAVLPYRQTAKGKDTTSEEGVGGGGGGGMKKAGVGVEDADQDHDAWSHGARNLTNPSESISVHINSRLTLCLLQECDPVWFW